MKTQTMHIPRTILDLDKTFTCGQTFLWDNMPDKSWIGCINDQPVVLKQTDSELTIVGDVTGDDIVSYFDLDTSYTFDESKLSEYETKCMHAGQGIRILRQPLFDTVVQFVISQNNSMHRIKKSVQELCERYGQCCTVNNLVIHKFPELVDFRSSPASDFTSKLSADDWFELGVGYRAKSLFQLFDEFMKTAEVWAQAKSVNDTDKRITILQQLPGVGPKVASCVVLFADIYHDLDAFPLDTHMRKLIAREYEGHIDTSRFSPFAGVMQQYMFYYEACNK